MIGKPRDEITHLLWEDQMLKWRSTYLRPWARLLNRIIINTIIPRLGSHEMIYELDHKALYAIFGNISVNWARFILEQIKEF